MNFKFIFYAWEFEYREDQKENHFERFCIYLHICYILTIINNFIK